MTTFRSIDSADQRADQRFSGGPASYENPTGIISSDDFDFQFPSSNREAPGNPFNDLMNEFGPGLISDMLRNLSDNDNPREKNAAQEDSSLADKNVLDHGTGGSSTASPALSDDLNTPIEGLAASRYLTHPIQVRDVDVFERFGLERDGRPKTEVIDKVREGIVDHYKLPRRGLRNVPEALFQDSSLRFNEYIPYVKGLKDRHWITDPAKVNDPAAWVSAARTASADRNARLCEVRSKLSGQGLAFSEYMKERPLAYDDAVKKVRSTLNILEKSMSPAESIAVSQKIIESSSRTNAAVDSLINTLRSEGRALTFVRTAGKAAGVAAVATDSFCLAAAAKESWDTGDWKPAARESCRIAGGWTGAALASGGTGAVAGSVLPGLGTIGGFVVGAVAGAVGYSLGSHLSTAAFDEATK